MHVIDNFLPYSARILFLLVLLSHKKRSFECGSSTNRNIKKYSQKYEIKAATNLGYCFAGLITIHSFSFYTTIGDTVNKAARL